MNNRTGAVSIRLCEDINDADALAAISAQTFSETFGQLYARENLEKFLREKHSPEVYRELLADEAHALWLAEEGGVAIGYLVAGPCSLPVPDMPENSGELMRFYILKTHQGAGLGGRMLAPALDWLDDNFDHVYLSVYAENFGAQRLYARCGFEKVHDYHYMVGDHADPEFIMKRFSKAGEDVERAPGALRK